MNFAIDYMPVTGICKPIAKPDCDEVCLPFMKSITEKSRRLPVAADADVAVVGGGMAGLAAAVAAARAGARTVLLERFGFCGGLATGGLIAVYWVLDDGIGHNVYGGLNREVLTRLDRMGYLWTNPVWRGRKTVAQRRGKRNAPFFDPEAMKLLADRMLKESRVMVLYHTHACRPILDGGIIRAVPVETKSGRRAVLAKVFVDATGDADLAAACGARCFENRSEKMTSWFRAAGSDVRSPHGADRFFKASPIIESGDFHGDAKGRAPSFDPLTSEGLTGWEMAAREMIFEKIAAMRKRLGRNVYPAGSPTHPNVRKTRRIVGAYQLGRTDNGRSFDDSVGKLGFWVKAGEVYQVPYRCLIPDKVKNLLVAGRAISTTEDGWDITRIISGCVLTGEACGAAAARAAKKRVSVREVDPPPAGL